MRIQNSFIIPLLLIAVFFLTPIQGQNQIQSPQDVLKALSSQNITFYGVNFENIRLIDQEGFIDKNGNTKCAALKNKYFNDYNEKFIIEDYKFDIIKYFEVSQFEFLSEETKLFNNHWIYQDQCITSELNYQMSNDEVAEIVQKYSPGKYQIGVLIIAESFSKKLGKGVFHLVYFDVYSKAILYHNKYEEVPSGIGFSAYWVNSLHRCLESHLKRIKKDKKKASKALNN